ncbi:Small-subunit processome [Babesia duncani]|uniref:Small-subunit processome n=1 Tax=Babesia duncani TaxID=323732 RepID=A0AAD9PMK0_9APIC|nr:Small-subunit processome [Babesia duncani]
MQPDVTSSNSQDVTNVKRFSKALTQALLSSDKQLLEDLLRSHDTAAIEETVADLTPAFVLSLLDYVCSNLIKSPNQIYARDGWITLILRRHCDFLSKNPKAQETLRKLNRHIKLRLATNQSLLKLKGKVDTLVYFSTLANKRRKMEEQCKQQASDPLVTFVQE